MELCSHNYSWTGLLWWFYMIYSGAECYCDVNMSIYPQQGAWKISLASVGIKPFDFWFTTCLVWMYGQSNITIIVSRCPRICGPLIIIRQAQTTRSILSLGLRKCIVTFYFYRSIIWWINQNRGYVNAHNNHWSDPEWLFLPDIWTSQQTPITPYGKKSHV
jgi:hypothetical protein